VDQMSEIFKSRKFLGEGAGDPLWYAYGRYPGLNECTLIDHCRPIPELVMEFFK